MKFRFIYLAFASVLFTTVTLFASPNDTMVVRLKSGAWLRGLITSRNDVSFMISGYNLKEQEVAWTDVVALFTSTVHDSLRAEKAYIVLPAPEIQPTWFDLNSSVDFLVGGAFQFDRGLGFGLNGRVAIDQYLNVGVMTVLHFGNYVVNNEYGHGSFLAWGPEVSTTCLLSSILLEPSVSVGGATIKTEPTSIYSSTRSNLFVCPGIGCRLNAGGIKVGVQYKYFRIKSLSMSAIYLSFGN